MKSKVIKLTCLVLVMYKAIFEIISFFSYPIAESLLFFFFLREKEHVSGKEG